MKRFVSALALATVALLPGAATAQDPVTVQAQVHNETVSPGDFQIGSCLIENNTGEPLLVRITAGVTYADGETQNFRINQPPTLIDAGGALIFEIFFAVPADAALGTATFFCTAQALGTMGGFRATGTATFQVV